ncbi:MAG: hypothetical protein WA888_18460 [Burkholderiaceae bacterium]
MVGKPSQTAIRYKGTQSRCANTNESCALAQAGYTVKDVIAVITVMGSAVGKKGASDELV